MRHAKRRRKINPRTLENLNTIEDAYALLLFVPKGEKKKREIQGKSDVLQIRA